DIVNIKHPLKIRGWGNYVSRFFAIHAKRWKRLLLYVLLLRPRRLYKRLSWFSTVRSDLPSARPISVLVASGFADSTAMIASSAEVGWGSLMEPPFVRVFGRTHLVLICIGVCGSPCRTASFQISQMRPPRREFCLKFLSIQPGRFARHVLYVLLDHFHFHVN